MISKEKYNISSRAISLTDLNRIRSYQLELINFMLYEPVTEHRKSTILDEIKNVEKYLKTNYNRYVQ